MSLPLAYAKEFHELPKEQQSAEMDAEIAEFSSFMETLSDKKAQGPLVGLEKMILKTYLIYVLKSGREPR